jgi:hypothetical protein
MRGREKKQKVGDLTTLRKFAHEEESGGRLPGGFDFLSLTGERSGA